MRVVGGLAVGFASGVAVACAPAALREPPFVEMTGSPITTACIAPSAWSCIDPAVTRKDALAALEVADLARAVQKPGDPRPASKELLPRPTLVEEDEALLHLRDYVACHPWDLDQTFELARRNGELNRFASASYLFLRVAENSRDDRAALAFLRALESLNAIAMTGVTECYDEMNRRVPVQVERLCTGQSSEECTALRKIADDLRRLRAQEARR